MKYYCGIDGGGTKTAILLIDAHGHECAKMTVKGSSHRTLGAKGVVKLFEESIEQCLWQAGIGMKSLAGIVAGIPCFGEDKAADEAMTTLMRQCYPDIPFYFCNDAEVGWAGSLGLKPGINIVAGTGSIAFGKNSDGKCVRCGGWSTFFGDEGSCYWLGRKTVELFSKQMDGRQKKDCLYDIIMDNFKPNTPEEFINDMENNYAPDRSKVAGLQRYLLMAAKEGDNSAAALYKDAADELGMMAYAAAKQIMIPGEQLGVALSGGLTYAKAYFFERLIQWIDKFNGYFVQSELFPVQGAALMAVQKFSNLDIEAVKKGLEGK